MHLYPFAIILLEISKLCVIICLRKVCWIELSKKKKKKHVHLFVCFAFVMAAYKLPIKTTFRLEAQQSESQVLSFRALRLVAHQHSAAHSCVEAPLRCSVCVCVCVFFWYHFCTLQKGIKAITRAFLVIITPVVSLECSFSFLSLLPTPLSLTSCLKRWSLCVCVFFFFACCASPRVSDVHCVY